MSFAAAQATYVLHSRPYKETNALMDFFTPLDRLCVVLRGVHSKAGTSAQLFVSPEAERHERDELKAVARLESTGIPNLLNDQTLFSGLYLNKLLTHLLPAEGPQPEIFAHYAATLPLLAAGRLIEPLLRVLEWRLPGRLGYSFALDVGIDGCPIEPQALYQPLPEVGLESVAQPQPGLFRGSKLLSMADADWSAPGVLAVAKRLMRQALAPHLGSRPLVSRELFMNRRGSPRD